MVPGIRNKLPRAHLQTCVIKHNPPQCPLSGIFLTTARAKQAQIRQTLHRVAISKSAASFGWAAAGTADALLSVLHRCHFYQGDTIQRPPALLFWDLSAAVLTCCCGLFLLKH
jgi:hypothetical protein